MGRRAEAVVERREPLSRERLLRTAMDVADTEGIAALSMRNLARELGVEAMSLYHYVPNKEEILAELVEMVMSEVEPPAIGGRRDWKAEVRRGATSYRDALQRHPWVHSVMTSAPQKVRPSQLRYMESLLGCLRQGGFSPMMTHHAYHILESHVIGSTLWEAGIRAALPKGSLPKVAQSFIERLPPADFPYTLEHIDQHMTKMAKGDKSPFDFGLDLILEGLDRLRDEKPKQRRKKA